MRLLEKKSPGEIGLIGHIIVNYPSQKDAQDIVDVLVKNKVDLIELQIPFSEPVADGPIFTKANHEALQNGVTVDDCFAFMSKVSTKYSTPFVFMTYANIAFKQGYSHFVKMAKEAGAKGAIIPDLPLDIADEYLRVSKEQEFAAIPVIAPNTSGERLGKISPFFDGFIYAVARKGVTGSKTEFNPAILEYLQKIRHYTPLPIAIGFGVASAKDLDFLRSHADYAVIGTETLRAFQDKGLDGVVNLWEELSKASSR